MLLAASRKNQLLTYRCQFLQRRRVSATPGRPTINPNMIQSMETPLPFNSPGARLLSQYSVVPFLVPPRDWYKSCLRSRYTATGQLARPKTPSPLLQRCVSPWTRQASHCVRRYRGYQVLRRQRSSRMDGIRFRVGRIAGRSCARWKSLRQN
jgi:hypothetical protein